MKRGSLSFRKISYLFLISILTFSVSSCRLPGMPDKDPANTLRTYYKEGENAGAVNHYIKYKLIAETSDISYPAWRFVPFLLKKTAENMMI